jgi:hypothetical protein
MAKVRIYKDISQDELAPLHLDVEWRCNRDQSFFSPSYIFIKVKVFTSDLELIAEDWCAGILKILKTGERICTAQLTLTLKRPEHQLKVKTFKSIDGISWVADGASDVTIHENSIFSLEEEAEANHEISRAKKAVGM